MYSFVLALLFHLWALASTAPPPAGSSEDSASLEVIKQPGLANITLWDSDSNRVLNTSNRVYPDPYKYVVQPRVLTIEFYGYQGTVNRADLDTCMRNANDKVTRATRGRRAQASMGPNPYIYNEGSVTLYLSPGKDLTWSRWSLAPAAIKRFVLGNELKGMQFRLLWRGTEPVGYGELVVMEGKGIQSPVTTTATAIQAFPDPYDRRWESAGLTIEFYGYRGSISPYAMRDCIQAACDDFRRHVPVIERPMTEANDSYSYSAGGVNLYLTPTEDLFWVMWGFLPMMFQVFVTENEFKGMQFIILRDGFGPVGSGHLIQESTGGLSLS